MDELPDLRSDADVDALMARLRARITPPPAPVALAKAGAASAESIADLLTLQEALAATVARAMTVVVDALEEFGIEEAGSARQRVRPRTTPRRKKP